MAAEVMIALDGSEKEARAMPVATALAELSGAAIHLVRVIHAPSDRITAQAELLGVDQAAMIARPEVERRMDEIARRLAVETKREVTWSVLQGTDVAAELMRHATTRDALVVVMGTRAGSAAGMALVGSVADRVMRECPRPVVLVPPGADYMRGKHVELGRVLVPLDGSALANRSIDYLLTLPHATRLEYVLLEVVPSSRGKSQLDARIATAEERLRAAAARVRAHGATEVETRVMDAGEPATAIAAAVRDVFVELVAMSTRGAGGLRRLVLGSVAEGVVRAAEVPVLLLTPTMLAQPAPDLEASVPPYISISSPPGNP